MVRAGVKVTPTAAGGTAFGSGDEVTILESYFRVPGGPPGKPYRAIWEPDAANYWRDSRYPGRALQRIRTDRVSANRAFFQTKTAGTARDLWALRPTAGADLVATGIAPVRLVDLAIWYGRNQDVADIRALVAWFLGEFPLRQGDLIPTLYSEDIPPEYEAAINPLAPDRASQADYASVIGAAPVPPSYGGTAAKLASDLEACVSSKGFISSPRFVSRVVTAWLRGDVVVLVGQPGTGKTYFASLVGGCLEEVLGVASVTWVPVRADFDEGEFIGYEGLDGTAHLREFAQRVLETDDPLATHLVVLDEFNLASVETYLASVLIAMEERERQVSLPGGTVAVLPVDTFILATCNSYLDEPESRLRVSYPTKRRSSVITMPNVLLEQFETKGAVVFETYACDLIKAEAASVQERVDSGRATSSDAARLGALTTVSKPDDLSTGVRNALATICEAIIKSPEGRDWFTLGLLKDMAVGLALSPRNEPDELVTLGELVADKLLSQLRGPKHRADELASAIAALPNAALATSLLERMKSGPTDDLVQLV